MTKKSIIVSNESLLSQDNFHLIQSNIQYITKLFQNNVHDDNISEDALKSYYVDYYLSHIQHNGFVSFIESLHSNSKTFYYICEGLRSINAPQHLQLLTNALNFNQKNLNLLLLSDNIFFKLQKKENLLELNYKWLLNHPHLLILESDEIEERLQEQIKMTKVEKHHTKVIKELCNIVNEDFLRVTAGDDNNMYNNSWYFKTTQGHYYMIEKDKKATMYNSFTKEKILTSKIKNDLRNKDKSFFSTLLS